MRRVAIIGPGRVGTALALALQQVGDQVVAVAGGQASRTLDAFEVLVPDAAPRPLEQVAAGADLVLVTTPDDRIATAARQVAAADGVVEGQHWVHTSGSRGLDELSIVADAGGRIAACHPAMTFPDPQTGAEKLRGASWAITAADADLGWARLLVVDLGGSPVTLAPEHRTLYHAGLSVGSNATTAVASLARDMLLGAGIDDPASFLAPLVSVSGQGGAVHGARALTGPVRRADVGTVEAHIEELRRSFPEAVETYVALARLILREARRAGMDPESARRVSDVLDRHVL